jgi:predicted dienelactone hydrolase
MRSSVTPVEVLELHDCGRPNWRDRAAAVAAAGDDYADARMKTAFPGCPAVGPMLDEARLESIRRPVAVRAGDANEIAPPAENAKHYAALIPHADGRSAGPEVDHYAFLGDYADGEDVRGQVAADAVAFFRTRLTR